MEEGADLGTGAVCSNDLAKEEEEGEDAIPIARSIRSKAVLFSRATQKV
jgi:hypothetical protein